MGPQTSDALAAKDKRQILLAEYAGLRTDIINRVNNSYQLLAAAVVLIALAVQHQNPTRLFWISILVAIAAVLFFVWSISIDVHMLASRIRQIEKRVNELAQERLLI